MGATQAGAVLFALLGTQGGSGLPPEGASPASLAGLWRATISGTARDLEGVAISLRFSTFLEFTDLDGSGVSLAPFAGQCTEIPATSGVRLPTAFFVEGPGASMAGKVRVDAATGEGVSFEGVLNFNAGGRIASLQARAKRAGAPDPPQSLFAEAFEAGLGSYVETDASGNPASTLWHAEGFCAAGTPIPASMGTAAAAYNRGDENPPVYTYATGAANSGALRGPLLAVPKSALGLTARFEMLRDTEGTAGFDQSFFEVQCPGELSWRTVAEITTEGVACGAAPVVFTIGPTDPALNAALRESFAHRFLFDTVDAGANNHLGWTVDGVEIGFVKSTSGP